MAEPWLFIPQEIFDLGKYRDQADEWLTGQRTALADQWAEAHQRFLDILYQQWGFSPLNLPTGPAPLETPTVPPLAPVPEPAVAPGVLPGPLPQPPPPRLRVSPGSVGPDDSIVAGPTEYPPQPEYLPSQDIAPSSSGEGPMPTAPAPPQRVHPQGLPTVRGGLDANQQRIAGDLGVLRPSAYGPATVAQPIEVPQGIGRAAEAAIRDIPHQQALGRSASQKFMAREPMTPEEAEAFQSGFGNLAFGVNPLGGALRPTLSKVAKVLKPSAALESISPNVDKIAASFVSPTPIPDISGGTLLQKWALAFQRAWTDPKIDAIDIVEQFTGTLGKLPAQERIDILEKLNPVGPAVIEQQKLAKVVQILGDQTPLAETLAHLRQVGDQALEVGARVEREILATPLPTPLAERNLQAAEGYKRLLTAMQAKSAVQMPALQTQFQQEAGIQSQMAKLPTTAESVARLAELQTKIDKLTLKANAATTKLQAAQTARGAARKAEIINTRVSVGGLTKADADAEIATMQQKLGSRFAVVDNAAKQLAAINRDMLTRRFQSGGLTQEAYDHFLKVYPNYTPTEILEHMADDVSVPVGRSISVDTSGIKTLTEKGSAAEKKAPLLATLDNVYGTYAWAAKNDAANAFHAMMKKDPNMMDTMGIVPVLPSTETKAGEFLLTGFANGSVPGDVRGTKFAYIVPEYLSNAVTRQALPGVPPIIRQVLGIWQGLVTKFSLAFMKANFFGDMATYMVQEGAASGGIKAVPSAMVDLMKAYGDAFQGIFSGTYHGQTARLFESGGYVGSRPSFKPKDYESIVSGLSQKHVFEIRNAGDAMRLVRDALSFKPVAEVSSRIELAPHVAAFTRAEREGMAPLEAAITRGRPATIDFESYGEWAKVVNGFIPFFGAAVQGGRRAISTIYHYPKQTAGIVLGTLVGPSLAVEIYNRSDPQRSADYDDVPQYIKDNAIVIMAPWPAPVDAQGNRHPDFQPIYTRSYTPFVTMTREIANKVIGKDSRAWHELVAATLSNVSPYSTTATGLMPLPPITQTMASLIANKDLYRQRVIATERMNEQASPLAKTIAGVVDTDPARVEYLGRAWGGGPARAVSELSQAVSGQPPTYATSSPSSVPVVGAAWPTRGDIGAQLQKARNEAENAPWKADLKAAGVSYTPALAPRELNGISLTMIEQADYQFALNREIDETMTQLLSNPAMDVLSSSQIEELVRHQVALARKRAAAIALGRLDPGSITERLQAPGVR